MDNFFRQQMKGFTLLEMIIVLSLIGTSLIYFTRQKSREVTVNYQQNLSRDILVDAYGIFTFIKQRQLSVTDSSGDKINPLYDLTADPRYHRRFSIKAVDPSSGLWFYPEERNLLTSSACAGSNRGPYALAQEFLRCHSRANDPNQELFIERVDMINNMGTLPVQRLDIYLSYRPRDKQRRLAFVDYLLPIQQQAANLGLVLYELTVIHRPSCSSLSSKECATRWKAVHYSNAEGNDAALPLELMAAQLKLPEFATSHNVDFGIRLSLIPGQANFLHTDGSSFIDQDQALCWEPSTGTAAFCLNQQQVELGGRQYNALRVGDDHNPGLILGTELLQRLELTDGSIEYSTPPIVRYMTHPDDGNAIQIPQQACPEGMFSRAQASLANLLSDKSSTSTGFASLSEEGNLFDVELQRLSAAFSRIRAVDKKWIIDSYVGIYDERDNIAVTQKNSKNIGLSVLLWCSTQPQP